MVLILIAISACNTNNNDSLTNENTEDKNIDVDVNEKENVEIEIDTNEDNKADMTIKKDDEVTEIVIPIDEPTKVTDEWCVPGSTYTYDSSEGSVDSEVEGLSTYKGKEFCKAQSTSIITSPAGDITSDTTYYFDSDYNEYWIIVTTSSAMMPNAQVNEIHIVDGETIN